MFGSILFLLSSTLLTASAAPACPGEKVEVQRPFSNRRQMQWQRRDVISSFAETQTLSVLETLTTTSTHTSTTTDGLTPTASSSQVTSATPLSTGVPAIDGSPNPSDVTSVLFLPTGDLSLIASSISIISTASSIATSFDSVATGSSTSESISILPPFGSASALFAPSATLLQPNTVSTLFPSATSPPSNSTGNSSTIVAAYYPDWASTTLAPENIDFTRFDWIDYAFAIPSQNLSLTWDDDVVAPSVLTRLVTAGHSAGKKVKLSIGGWDGSTFFSSACSNATSRQKFVTNIATFYSQFNLDGVDIDWEYPGLAGNGNNTVSPQDSANFLAFLQLLRTTLPQTAKITAAVQVTPFVDSTGKPMSDVSAFAEVLDWVMIMNYDTWASSSTPGANAPLSDACHNSTQPQANAEAAVKAWTTAKFPASKLILGVPSYGYVNTSNATSLRARHNSRLFRRAASATQNVKLTADDDTGELQFNELISQGALVRDTSASANNNTSTDKGVTGGNGNNSYVGAAGFTRFWDSCSSTPFLTSPSAEQIVTYDDQESLQLKAAFAKQAGILGVEMFDVTGDTTQWELTDAIRQGLGVE